MTVMTVTGAVKASKLGITLCHEHVLIDLYKVYQPHRDMYLHDKTLAAQEIGHFAASGGGTLVDLTTTDMGRDARALKRISDETGVLIVMGTGRYRTPFYEAEIESMSTADLTRRFIIEINEGEQGIKPGVIGEIGTNGPFVSGIEERVHRAAARASISSGLPLITHSLGSDVGLSQLAIFVEEGLDPAQVAIGHADTWPEPDYHLALADQGAYLLFDTLRGRVEYETRRVLQLVQILQNSGFGEQLLFSHDVCSTSHYRAYGGEGYTYVSGRFIEEAERFGIDPQSIRGSLTQSAQCFLSNRLSSDLSL